MKTPPHPASVSSPWKVALHALAYAACCGALVGCCPAPPAPPAAEPCPPCPPCPNEPRVGTQPATQPASGDAPQHSGSADGSQSPGSCHDLVARAVDELERVEEKNKSCAMDADCVVVDRKARCFDSCATVISVDGLSAYQQAKQRANQGPCAEFASRGCTPNPPPPCTPPARPRCVAGTCGWYLPEG